MLVILSNTVKRSSILRSSAAITFSPSALRRAKKGLEAEPGGFVYWWIIDSA